MIKAVSIITTIIILILSISSMTISNSDHNNVSITTLITPTIINDVPITNSTQEDHLAVEHDYDGGVCLSFDDSYIDSWDRNVIPLLDKYGATATFYICYPDRLTSENYNTLNRYEDSGYEIGCHGYAHMSITEHAKLYGNDHGYYDAEAMPCLDILKDNGLTVKTFAYPMGYYNGISNAELLDNGFKTIRGAYWKPETGCTISTLPIYYDAIDNGFVNAGFIDVEYSFSLSDDEIQSVLKYAHDNDMVVCLVGHSMSNNKRLDNILSYVSANNMRYYTVGEL